MFWRLRAKKQPLEEPSKRWLYLQQAKQKKCWKVRKRLKQYILLWCGFFLGYRDRWYPMNQKVRKQLTSILPQCGAAELLSRSGVGNLFVPWATSRLSKVPVGNAIPVDQKEKVCAWKLGISADNGVDQKQKTIFARNLGILKPIQRRWPKETTFWR